VLDWEIYVIDIDSAFPNSEIPKDQPAYVKQPTGYEAKGKEHLVWLLLKVLYGLKQSGYLWYNKLKLILTQIGFQTCRSDPCVFYQTSPTSTSIIASHVDDLGLYCSSVPKLQSLKSSINAHVSFKDQGNITHILSIEIIRNQTACTISFLHRHYIDLMLKIFCLEDVNPIQMPAATGDVLSAQDCPTSAKEIQYMQRVPY